MRSKLLVIALAALAVATALGFGSLIQSLPVALAQSETGRTAVNEDLTIDKDEVVEGDVSVTDGNLKVYGSIQGNVAVFNGGAFIDGKVSGDVVVFSGDIELGPHSAVGHDVAALAGKIVRDPAAKVGGRLSAPALSLNGLNDEVIKAPATLPGAAESAPASPQTWLDRFISFFAEGMVSLILLVLGLLVASVLPRRVHVSSLTLEREPASSIIVGLITAFLLPPTVFIAAFVLAISIVGILLLPVLGVAVGLVWLYGLVTVSGWLGKRFHEASHMGNGGAGLPVALEVLMGMALILGTTILPTLFLSRFVTVIMVGLIYFAGCVGLGAALLSRFGTLVPPKHAHLSGHAPSHAAYRAPGGMTPSASQPQSGAAPPVGVPPLVEQSENRPGEA